MGTKCRACAEGVDPPTQGSTGPIVLADHRGCHGHDGEAVLVESRGSKALIQEGPPLVFPAGVLSV
jgi:hypothetical protein